MRHPARYGGAGTNGNMEAFTCTACGTEFVVRPSRGADTLVCPVCRAEIARAPNAPDPPSATPRVAPTPVTPLEDASAHGHLEEPLPAAEAPVLAYALPARSTGGITALGVLALVFGFASILTFGLAGPIALILDASARSMAKAHPYTPIGARLSDAGKVLAIVGILAGLTFLSILLFLRD